MELQSAHTGPCTSEGKVNFVDWLKEIDMAVENNWLILGDFNLIRYKMGGNANEMLMFNDAITALGLIELPLHDQSYTWSNKQQNHLLEKLDWFFTSATWTTSFPAPQSLLCLGTHQIMYHVWSQ